MGPSRYCCRVPGQSDNGHCKIPLSIEVKVPGIVNLDLNATLKQHGLACIDLEERHGRCYFKFGIKSIWIS